MPRAGRKISHGQKRAERLLGVVSEPKKPERTRRKPVEFDSLKFLNCRQCGELMPAKKLAPTYFVNITDDEQAGPFCRPCRERFLIGLERARKNRANYRSNYGLTLTQYGEIYVRQHGLCAICGCPQRGGDAALHVDHDHHTGEVRGLLCGRCNTAIGLFDDNPTWLASAIVYLTTRIDTNSELQDTEPETG